MRAATMTDHEALEDALGRPRSKLARARAVHVPWLVFLELSETDWRVTCQAPECEFVAVRQTYTYAWSAHEAHVIRVSKGVPEVTR